MSSPEKPRETLWWRIHRALGPIAGGLLLDFVDLATFGPVGLFGGFLLGAAVGWWIAAIYGFSPKSRTALAGLAALYTAIPFTEMLPAATLVSAMARFRERKPPAAANENDRASMDGASSEPSDHAE